MELGIPEFADNPENRCPVVLLLDTSGSMAGNLIQELNRGIVAFHTDVIKDAQASMSVDVAIITFGPVTLVQDFIGIEHFMPPELKAGGLTPMGAAIEYGLDILEQRKAQYKNNGIRYYRPWVFLITDGTPTDNWAYAAQRLKEGENNGRLSFFAVGVEGADFETLKEISPERPPVQLNGLNFSDLFIWLSASMKRVSSTRVGEAVALPAMGWGEIKT